ncbi:uncharacterized protein [Phyllobates terribilis]|uniref:uncharacterized protein n=1 Tax=Phyllobates terribilis TaxID=111132 RepID=UPI003CCB33A4
MIGRQFTRLYNLSGPERQAMKDYISESLAKGHIRPSSSPVAAGFFFVKKKDGGLRPCLDFRELNRITVRDPYPLPLIPDLFNQIVGAKWFSKLDLRGAYNLIRMKEGDEWKTAFNTPEGHYENLVMPFGLTNAPAVFQHFVNDIFRRLVGQFVVIYLDDILIYSPDLVSHQEHAKLPKARLYNLSGPERQAMKDYISESLAKGHIRPSSSPVAAGFFFVKKKDGGLRPCLDFRELNRITVRDPYPLPLIPDLFNQIVGAKWFSKLDLRGAYNLIRMKEGDEWKTAFNTPEGHYENLVMPFGLTNAPAVFQHFVNDIFRRLVGQFVVIYLDDILIYSPDLVSHQEHPFETLATTHGLAVRQSGQEV